jgi:hydroxyacylglutathione hydrolase
MIIERAMNTMYLSNTYLVADAPGGHAVLVDSGGPLEPILNKIDELDLTLSHLLCTHHHIDHIAHNSDYKFSFGSVICAHGSDRDCYDDLDMILSDGDELTTGELRIKALHTPGHTRGGMAYLINDESLFTGDTLFRHTIGGTRAPGHTTFEDIQNSIMNVLMQLPGDTKVYPGHTETSSIAEEWEHNPFIRLWRGLDDVVEKPCTALGQPATLLLRAGDYDGGTKCWVRFDADGKLDIVAGSRVED